MNGASRETRSFRLERYESKFVIPFSMIEPISDFASVYCFLDLHSIDCGNADGFYVINNLYFDTPDYLFLRKRLDMTENRFNMRIRSYDDNHGLPCFFEIKQKKSTIIRKFRARIDEPGWPGTFQNPDYELDEDVDKGEDSDKWLFLKTVWAYGAEPKVLTQYRRKAYVSDVDHYARVTFDMALKYQPADGYSLIPDEEKMIPLDNETLFDPGCNVILELKCFSTQVPLWMIDLIRRFDLRRRGFSKYKTGVSEVINSFGYDHFFRNSVL